MTWMDGLERERKLLVVGIVLIGVTMLTVTAMRDPVSADAFWHLQMGKSWIENGLSPWTDHFSFTFNGHAITNPPYLFQASIHYFVVLLGTDIGMKAFKLFSFLLVYALVVIFLRQIRAPVIIYLVVLTLLVAVLQLRAMLRPELISYSLSVVALMLYRRAWDSSLSKSMQIKSMQAKSMLPIVLLMWFWSNYHTPVMGYIIFFGLFVDIGLQQLRHRVPAIAWSKWLGWGVAVIAIGIVNPSLTHPLFEAVLMPAEWKVLIQEYRPIAIYAAVPTVYLIGLLAIAAICLQVRQNRPGLAVVSAILMLSAIRYSRLVTPAGVILLCIFAQAAAEAGVQAWWKRRTQYLQSILMAGLLIMSTIGLYLGYAYAVSFLHENQSSKARFPDDITAYMNRAGISGRIFNKYGIGGFLAYQLLPGSSIYIDGRTVILYPIEHYQLYEAAMGSGQTLRVEIEKYSIDMVMTSSNNSLPVMMAQVEQFGLDFMDAGYSLYRRNQPNFPNLGLLMAHPACWRADMANELDAERRRAVETLPLDSPAHLYLNLILQDQPNFASHKVAFERSGGGAFYDFHRRYRMFQAIGHGEFHDVAELFIGLRDRWVKDYLALAFSLSLAGDWEAMANVLEETVSRNWPVLAYEDLQVLHALLTQINATGFNSQFDDAYLSKLRDQMRPEDLVAGVQPVTVAMFCPPNWRATGR